MKTIILTLFGALVMGNSNATEPNKSIYSVINNSITYPTNSVKPIQNDFAIVEFTINEDGNLEILGSNSSNTSIILHVEKELCLIKFEPTQYEIGKRYIYRFSFSD